jgi:hypothetical protein
LNDGRNRSRRNFIPFPAQKPDWNNRPQRWNYPTVDHAFRRRSIKSKFFLEIIFMYKSKFAVFSLALALVLGLQSVSAFAKPKKQMRFKVRVENVSTGEQANKSGSKYPFALSPGVFVVSNDRMPLFEIGGKASNALEMQAEDGNPMGLVESIGVKSGAFNKPVGADMPAPILPGQAYEFEVNGTEGQKLMLAAMFGQSNDLFYAPSRAIDLFVNGEPLNADITDMLRLWDAGTEVNQEPGTGADQAPRQKAANSGSDEKGVVRLVVDGFVYPETNSVLKVTVTPVTMVAGK